jgi:putative colanic acid biosysnthesis UDP-glucose lipid carrier transferase
MRQYSKTSTFIHNTVIIGDFVVLNILYYAYIHLDYVAHTLTGGISPVRLLLLANLAMAVAQYFFSNVVHQRHANSAQVLRQVSLLCFFQCVSMWLLTEIAQSYDGSSAPDIRLSILFLPLLLVCLLFVRFLERHFIRFYRGHGHNQRHAVFVGANPSTVAIYKYLMSDPALGYKINGYFADHEMEDCPEGLKYRGDMKALDKIMENHLPCGTAEELYCCLPLDMNDYVSKLMRYCNGNTIHFYYIPVYPIMSDHSLQLERVGDTMAFTTYNEPLQKMSNRIIKRTFDLFVSSIVLLCMLPFLPFIALGIKCSSPGPIFFRQARTGINGRRFYCYKFRSMDVNKDADTKQATKDDPRKFAFGNFMRKTNIDELPQFFNVFIGDMSIVGPRPHMLCHTEMYRDRIDTYMVRHFIKPGITGWAQVTGYRGETKELWQMEGRVQRDIWYMEHWNLWLDLVIIWKTAVMCIKPDKHAY